MHTGTLPRAEPAVAGTTDDGLAVSEHRFRAMGSDAHVILVGAPPTWLVEAHLRIDRLEQRWSRFLRTSEVSELNAQAGSWVAISEDTRVLLQRATEAWRLTGGRFDPTVLGAMLDAGYDTSYDRIDPAIDRPHVAANLFLGCEDIEVVGHQARLPPDTGFDPGGIGKGLAADLVVAELLDRGAPGACVNLGGDVRVGGTGPTGDGWTIDAAHAWAPSPVARIGVTDGGVATSTTLLRRWRQDGENRHHLIDPDTGRPSETDLTSVTVIAGKAWMAEVLAKAVLLRGSTHPFDIVDGCGAEALTVDDRGRVEASAGLARFLDGATLPAHIDLTDRTDFTQEDRP